MKLIRKLNELLAEKRKKINIICDDLIMQINTALEETKMIFSNNEDAINESCGVEWIRKYSPLLIQARKINLKRIRKASNHTQLVTLINELFDTVSSLNEKIRIHNETVEKIKIINAYNLIGQVEGQTLDEQQMACIVKQAHNHLVIAGAGTGKTTTIVGKIKFLLKSNECKEEDILVLSFTDASASEMKERINKETNAKIAASTFHKLGLNIIKEVNNITPKITKIDLNKFIKEQLLICIQSETYLQLLNSYLIYNRIPAKSEFEFKTEAEYQEYLKINSPTTINKEVVKSYGELDIANFLMQNGISYIYENPYKIDTRTSEYGQYHPDFYLPDYDMYIEYFGINKDGKVPSYFKSKNNMTATETYQASMTWKRKLHSDNNTTIIECYAYEKWDGSLLNNLKQHLIEKNVKFTPKSSQELWEHISIDDTSLLNGIAELFGTIINLIKSNNYTIEDVKEIIKISNHKESNSKILSLVEPIFNKYASYLLEHHEIDFNDMINLATQYINQGKYINPYKYVIVDEYQDISKARYLLLKALRSTSDFKLFCVGDDWQSIYRFAGSDIGYILNFEHYWGTTEISKIETTYRFTQKLIEISSNFIMSNPEQIKKDIKGKNEYIGFPLSILNGYTENNVIEFMKTKLEDLPKNNTVFFIGRYSFDINIIKENNFFNCQYNNINKITDITYKKRPDLKINFVTAHKSKGLQADYVFILNNKKAKTGFPSKIQEAPILNLLLESCDQYPFSEERRLFYVALTRAKKKAILLTIQGQESEFVTELEKQYEDELKQERYECPNCGGRLVKKTGPYGEFVGCSNYKITGCTYTRK